MRKALSTIVACNPWQTTLRAFALHCYLLHACDLAHPANIASIRIPPATADKMELAPSEGLLDELELLSTQRFIASCLSGEFRVCAMHSLSAVALVVAHEVQTSAISVKEATAFEIPIMSPLFLSSYRVVVV
jgi:hypothetical protein